MLQPTLSHMKEVRQAHLPQEQLLLRADALNAPAAGASTRCGPEHATAA
jgi:hypothetical protein